MIAPNAVSVTICGGVEALGEPRVQRVVDGVRVACRAGARSRRSARRTRRAAARPGPRPRRSAAGGRTSSRSGSRSAVEIAWQNSHVRRSPSTGATSSCSGYHCSSASSATGECASVHFMFVIRLPVATCAAASSREAGGAEDSSTGGMRAIRQILWLAACNPGASSAATGSRRSSARTPTSPCCARATARGPRGRAARRRRAARRAVHDPLPRARAPAAARSSTRTCSASTTRARSRAARSRSRRRRRAGAWTSCSPTARCGAAPAIRIVRQVASAVDALEEAGAEPPPLTAERIWVDDARRRPPRRPRRARSASRLRARLLLGRARATCSAT